MNGGGIAERWSNVDPNELVFTFRIFKSVPILVKIDKTMQP